MLFDDTYKMLEAPSMGIYKEKGSKFLSFAIPVLNETEVKEQLEQIRKEYFDARHHCYAYIIGTDKSAWRINDDGEPSGTAGKPILGQINSLDLTNTLIIVVRYFGGVKLGVSGLINAYKIAARDAIDHARIVEKLITEIYDLHFPYEMINDAMKVIKEFDLQIVNTVFDMNSTITFKVRRSHAERTLLKLKSMYRFKVIWRNVE